MHAINDLKYNPEATVLAAACADRHVDLYAVGQTRYSRFARCTGMHAQPHQPKPASAVLEPSRLSSVKSTACANVFTWTLIAIKHNKTQLAYAICLRSKNGCNALLIGTPRPVMCTAARVCCRRSGSTLHALRDDTGHSAAVRSLDWRADGKVLQSACAASELLYWNGSNGRQTTECQKDSQWASWTCALGFPVMGIWFSGADATDINSVCRDASGRFLTAADDRGLVRLLNYPCVVAGAPSRGYVGHSAHVTCVRFSEAGMLEGSAGDAVAAESAHGGQAGTATWLASCGGADRALFQFRLQEIQEEPDEVEEEPEPVWGPLDASGKAFGWRVPANPHKNSSGVLGTDRLPGKQGSSQPCAAAQAHSAGTGRADSDDDGGWGGV
jgi:WD40 repeat protein